MKEQLLVNERAWRYEPKHARCYCVATAAGVATVVGGVASVASNAINSSQAGSGIGQGSPSALYGTKIKPVKPINNVHLPSFDPTSGGNDSIAMIPYLQEISGRMTGIQTADREKIMPGSKAMMANAGTDLTALSKGEVSGDVVGNTQRMAAEAAGGVTDTASPGQFGGGGSQGVDTFARNIGRTSQDNQNEFLSAAPSWENLANSFVYSPDQANNMAMGMLNSRNQYTLGAGDLQKSLDEDQYTEQLNFNRTQAQADPQAVGAENDALLQQAIQGMSGGNGSFLTGINSLVAGLRGINSGYSGGSTAMGSLTGTGTGGPPPGALSFTD